MTGKLLEIMWQLRVGHVNYLRKPTPQSKAAVPYSNRWLGFDYESASADKPYRKGISPGRIEVSL